MEKKKQMDEAVNETDKSRSKEAAPLETRGVNDRKTITDGGTGIYIFVNLKYIVEYVFR
jgi:hypothetical protein